MKHSFFKDYHSDGHQVTMTTPEVRFMQHICQGGDDVEAFFHDKTANQEEVIIYTPYGRFKGMEGIHNFAQTFLGQLKATKAEVYPVIQTSAAGRSVTEAEIWFDIGQNEPYKIPMGMFADLGHEDKMEGLRLYFFYQWIPGTPAYYEPIYKPLHNEPADSNGLSGVMKYYYQQLHNFDKEQQLENLLDMFADNPRLGGYRSSEMTPPVINTKEVMRKKYTYIVENIPSDLYIRFESITDDGRNCMVEWTSVVRQSGVDKGLVSQAGMVGYERNNQGKICSVRICDNFKWEHEIDMSKVKSENNFIE